MEALFGTTGHVSIAQELARTVLVFICGFAMVRLAGRRVFGKWAALDIVVSIIVGSNFSRAITGSAPLWGTIYASALIMALHWILSHAAARHPRLAALLEGLPILLARAGRPEPASLRRHAVSDSDLQEALHQSGLNDLGPTRLVLLEPSGKITVLKG